MEAHTCGVRGEAASRGRGSERYAEPGLVVPILTGATVAAIAAVASALDVTSLGAIAGLVGPIVMYNRLNRGQTFDNDTRRRIFDYVRTMPGACIADVAGVVGVSHSTASYHLDKLLRFSMITSTVDGNKVRFFINGGEFTEEERRILSVLDNGETRRVLVTIMSRPWCYPAELTGALGVSSPTVNWHLERLTSAGVVTENRSGRNRFLFADKALLATALARILDKVKGTSYDAAGLEGVLAAAKDA